MCVETWKQFIKYSIYLGPIPALEGQLPSLVCVFIVITLQVIPMMFNASCYIGKYITVLFWRLLKFLVAVKYIRTCKNLKCLAPSCVYGNVLIPCLTKTYLITFFGTILVVVSMRALQAGNRGSSSGFSTNSKS